jgi:hypothetical protein
MDLHPNNNYLLTPIPTSPRSRFAGAKTAVYSSDSLRLLRSASFARRDDFKFTLYERQKPLRRRATARKLNFFYHAPLELQKTLDIIPGS